MSNIIAPEPQSIRGVEYKENIKIQRGNIIPIRNASLDSHRSRGAIVTHAWIMTFSATQSEKSREYRAFAQIDNYYNLTSEAIIHVGIVNLIEEFSEGATTLHVI